MIGKSTIFIIGIFSIFQIGSVYSQFGDFDRNNEEASPFDFIIERNDQMIYACMNLEELGGLDEDNDQVTEDNKKYCKELLKDTDFFKKKELIKKYGELG